MSRAGSPIPRTRPPRSPAPAPPRSRARLEDVTGGMRPEARGLPARGGGRRGRGAHPRRPPAPLAAPRALHRRGHRHDDLRQPSGRDASPSSRQLEQDYLMPTYARHPVEFVRGEGSRLWDSEDNEYLDFLSGIAVVSLGHAHPALVDAIRDQAGRLMHTTSLLLHAARAEAGQAALRELARRQGLLLQLRRRSSRVRDQAGPKAQPGRRLRGPRGRRSTAARWARSRPRPSRAKQEPFEPLVPGFTVVPIGTTPMLCAAAVSAATAGGPARADPGRGRHPYRPARGAPGGARGMRRGTARC